MCAEPPPTTGLLPSRSTSHLTRWPSTRAVTVTRDHTQASCGSVHSMTPTADGRGRRKGSRRKLTAADLTRPPRQRDIIASRTAGRRREDTRRTASSGTSIGRPVSERSVHVPRRSSSSRITGTTPGARSRRTRRSRTGRGARRGGCRRAGGRRAMSPPCRPR